MACKVLLQFDKSINQTLATRVKSRITFKASKLNTYRFCDNVWTFMLNDVEFREVQEITRIDKVKIVACDGKSKFVLWFFTKQIRTCFSLMKFCLCFRFRCDRRRKFKKIKVKRSTMCNWSFFFSCIFFFLFSFNYFKFTKK